jgi:hypothetical protein
MRLSATVVEGASAVTVDVAEADGGGDVLGELVSGGSVETDA